MGYLRMGVIFFSMIALLERDPKREQIDRQIAQLRDLQDKYRSDIQRDTNNAMRWQFQQENYPDARKAWDRAARNKQKIDDIQLEIDQLESEKRQQN